MVQALQVLYPTSTKSAKLIQAQAALQVQVLKGHRLQLLQVLHVHVLYVLWVPTLVLQQTDAIKI